MKSNNNKSADIVVDISFALLTLLSLCISPIYDTLNFALPVMGLVLISYYIAKYSLPNHSLYQYVGSASFALITALLIYQMHGMMEMHFIAFIAAIILIYYKKWQLQLPLTLLVVIHHVILAYIQFSGYKEVYFTSSDYMDMQTFATHLALAAIIFFLCGWWAFIFQKYDQESTITTESLVKQMKIINKNITLADEIAKGNLNTKIELTEGDLLAPALLLMQENLGVAKEKEEVEKFINIGIAQCAEILRQSNVTMAEFSLDILRFLAKYFEANQGAFFIINEDNIEDKQLELTACYAYSRHKHLSQRIEIGEGLVGTAFLEKDIIYLTDIPQNYIKITSGLGESLPRCIIIVPLMINEDVYGVIELAFFKPLESYQIELLKKLSENIASTVKNVKVNERTKLLLENSQKQSEELRAQEEEMRQNMEEMQATQEEMHRRQTEVSEFQRMSNSIIKSSPGAIFRTKIDKDWTLIFISEKIYQILGYSSQEFINHSVHLAQIIHPEDLIYVENEILQSLEKKTQYELKYRVKHKDNHYIHVWEIGEGVFDANGHAEFIEGIILDVSETKIKEEKIRLNLEAMQSTQQEMLKKEEENDKLLQEAKESELKISKLLLTHLEEIENKDTKIEMLDFKLKKMMQSSLV